MKIITEFIKIALLAAIFILLGVSTYFLKKPMLSEPIANKDTVEEIALEPNQREHDLRKIMEHSLAKLFKFPESVKYQDTEFEYKRVFKDHGITVESEKELEFATLCGQYSVQNAMAVYGSFKPFYAEVAVNNQEKGVTGDLWLKIDGEIKKLISLDSTVSLDGDEEEFKKLYENNCGDMDKSYMGVFSQYNFGYDALSVKFYSEELDKLSKYPDAFESLQVCSNSAASHDYCIGTELCQRLKELDENMSEWCSMQKQVCLANDKPADCESKIKSAYKEKKANQK